MKKTTLWELLKTEGIVIPIIQRDYAQGRKGKEYVRKAFLFQIKESLEKNDTNEEDKILNLDFIYGNTENNVFKPLDGQQRLTTLWLLHWYLSLKSGKLKDDADVLSRFTYETRNSSTEFFCKLCQAENFENYDSKEKISNFIKKQTWFYSVWLLDPTISSMLRTLSGDNNDNDNIETIFKNIDYGEYREKLINNVRFFRLDIGAEKLSSSDSLYIKMNARGKGLTNFENFKADLIDQLKKWGGQDFDSITIISKVDEMWTNVFWKSTKETLREHFNGEIDQAFFSFFNRYVLNEICLNTKNNATDFKERITRDEYEKRLQQLRDEYEKRLQQLRDEYENDQRSFEENKKKLDDVWNFYKLYGHTGNDDSMVLYEGFDLYKTYLTRENIKHINVIMDNLSNDKIYEEIVKFFSGVKSEEDSENSKKITFIPQYSYEEKPKEKITLNDTTLKERIYFYAVCQFLSKDKEYFDKDKFKKWMRVVKNITENAGIDSVSSMITCMHVVRNIANEIKNTWEIYEFLAKKYSIEKNDSKIGQQLNEEVEKAKFICDDPEKEKGIIDAENYAFFNGTIRFLYRNEQQKPCWDCFSTKFDTAKKLFKNDNVVPVETIQCFLNYFEKFEEIYELHLFTTIGYHNRNYCWKKDILCCEDDSLSKKVHNMLMEDEDCSDSQTAEFKNFVENNIKLLIEKDENYKFRCREYNECVVIQKVRKPEECLFVGDKFKDKYSILSETNGVCMNKTQYEFGLDIEFEWNQQQYCWQGGQRLYKLVNKKYIQIEGLWTDETTLLEILNNDKILSS